MAIEDYRKCDNCGCKAFYAGNLNYIGVSEDDEAVRGFDYHLESVGDWAVLCVDCAKTMKCVIVEIDKK